MNKKVENFEKAVERIKGNVKSMEQTRHELKESIRPLHQKKYDLTKRGSTLPDIKKVDKEISEIYDEVRFYDKQIEMTKEFAEAEKHEEVLALIEYREERYKEMQDEVKALREEFVKMKLEYMKQIHDKYSSVHDLQSELEEINDAIYRNGNAELFDNPKKLNKKELQGFSSYGRRDVDVAFPTNEDVEKATSQIPSFTLELYIKTGEIVLDTNQARLKLVELDKKKGGK